jgi:hypothetical protein
MKKKCLTAALCLAALALAQTRSLGSTAISVTVVGLDNINSPNWIAEANGLIADAETNALGTNSSVTSPTQYCVFGRRIGWTNQVYSTTVHMWGGVTNPLAPFDNELGGPLV